MRRSYSYRLWRTALLVLIFVAAYYLIRELRKPEAVPETAPTEAGIRLGEVIDGDTFRDSRGETIRLLGIDTPERGEPFYDEATEFLRSLLLNRELRYEFDIRKRDRHGRLLAYVFAGEDFVNRKMLESGLSSVYIFPEDMRNLAYRGLFIEDQKATRQAHRGIWSLPLPEPEKSYIGNPATFRFHRPDCYGARELSSEEAIIRETRDEFLDLGFSPCRNCRP